MKRLLGIVWTVAILSLSCADAATIVETAQQDGNFKKLLSASKSVGVDKALQGKGPFTLFAPDDAAFEKVPATKLQALMNPNNLEKLKTVLGSHLVTGVLTLEDIEGGLTTNDGAMVATVNNMPLVFKRENGTITVNGARFRKAPIRVENGLIYIIDTVLVPPMPLQPKY